VTGAEGREALRKAIVKGINNEAKRGGDLAHEYEPGGIEPHTDRTGGWLNGWIDALDAVMRFLAAADRAILAAEPRPAETERVTGAEGREALRDAAAAIAYAIEKLPPSGGRMSQAAERRFTEAMAMLDAALAAEAADSREPQPHHGEPDSLVPDLSRPLAPGSPADSREPQGLDVAWAVVKSAAHMGSCSQTHHEHLMAQAQAALRSHP
jgi:hypothetical protein